MYYFTHISKTAVRKRVCHRETDKTGRGLTVRQLVSYFWFWKAKAIAKEVTWDDSLLTVKRNLVFGHWEALTKCDISHFVACYEGYHFLTVSVFITLTCCFSTHKSPDFFWLEIANTFFLKKYPLKYQIIFHNCAIRKKKKKNQERLKAL